MEISEALKHKGRPYHIENCSTDDLAKFMKDSGCKVGVEVGVYLGAYSKTLCEAGFDRVYGVDPWGILPTYANVSPRFLNRQQEIFTSAITTLAPYKNFKPIRKTSMEAVEAFKEESIDFVYIDGNHKFKFIAEDLYEWARRVKPGGIVAGHDYYNSKDSHGTVRCKHVIDAYIKAFNIENFYTLAGYTNKKMRRSSHRDRWKSWFWIKE